MMTQESSYLGPSSGYGTYHHSPFFVPRGDYYDEVAFLDYLHILRSIALSESMAEFIHETSKSDSEQ